MARNKRRLLNRRSEDDLKEVSTLVEHQRRYDTDGRRLAGFSSEQIAAMDARQRVAVRADGWLVLPDLVTLHGPLSCTRERIELCPCAGCASARVEWRKRTGRV
jgi:hypothetical protein